MLEGLLRSEQIVFFEELSALIAEAIEFPRVALSSLVIIECDLFDDAGVDEFLDMLVDRGVAHAGVEFLEFIHRGEFLGVLEDIIDQREPRLLGDEVDEFSGFLRHSCP